MDLNRIIKKPLITEKSVQDAQKGKFTFIVEKTADKDAIKKAVEIKFSVHVTDVATLYIKGRKKRTGARRIEIDMPVNKKAIVSLKEGEKIDIFDIKSE